jgi:hypothetical protein
MTPFQCVLLVGLALCGAVTRSSDPNVVLILLDDQASPLGSIWAAKLLFVIPCGNSSVTETLI